MAHTYCPNARRGGHAQAQGCHAEGQALAVRGACALCKTMVLLGRQSLVVRVIRDKRSE